MEVKSPVQQRFIKRYIPDSLTKKDRKIQARMLSRSRKLYKQGKYYTRKKVASFHDRPSKHVANARRLYHIENLNETNPELVKATGCSSDALSKIVEKGEGAYFSSGSRPNQTAQSWGYARLASAITGSKSAVVDFDILDKGCDHKKKAWKYAKKAIAKYGKTLRRAPKTVV